MTGVEFAIGIPAYRPDPNQLRELLLSIEAQTYPVADIIISVDGAVQEGDYVRAMITEFPSVRVIETGARVGMVANWNNAAREARGTHVIVPGQDDVLMPQAIEYHSRAFGDQRVQISCGLVEYFGTDQHQSHQKSLLAKDLFEGGQRYLIPARQMVAGALCYGNLPGEPSSMCYSKAVFELCGGYSERYQHSADLDFALRASIASGSLALIALPLSARRLHSENATQTHISEGIAARDRLNLYLDNAAYVSNYKLRQRAVARLLTHGLWDLLRQPTRHNFAHLLVVLQQFRPSFQLVREVLETTKTIRPNAIDFSQFAKS